MTPTLSGLLPVLATPFAPDGSLDEAGLRRLVEFQLSCGVDGLAVFGLASEGFALTADERRRILHIVGEARKSGPTAVPVVAGVNATSTVTAVEQACASVEHGADALMVLPPFLVKPSPDQLVDFFGEIVAATSCPVMVQDAPASTGVNMPVPLLAELCKLNGISSVKVEAPPTAPKIRTLIDAVAPETAVIGGNNAFFLIEELRCGSAGTMPACEFTDTLAQVLHFAGQGDWRSARHVYDRLLPLVRFGMQPGLAWAVHKQVLVRRGIIDTPTVRTPARPLDSTSITLLDEILAELDAY